MRRGKTKLKEGIRDEIGGWGGLDITGVEGMVGLEGIGEAKEVVGRSWESEETIVNRGVVGGWVENGKMC